jgi:SAM-dependent methyltransferase
VSRGARACSPQGCREPAPAVAVTVSAALRRRTLDGLALIPAGAATVLDIGCNDGDLLAELTHARPELRCAGIDINPSGIAAAAARLPGAELHVSPADTLPFEDSTFDAAFCFDVLEHVPADQRRDVFTEAHRVLRPGGTLIVQVPHRGPTRVLDAQNYRHRWPGLYQRLVGRGLRDEDYAASGQEVVWHHHFTRRELLDLAHDRFAAEQTEYPGFMLAPLGDCLCWPFYRVRRPLHPIARLIARAKYWDATRNWGPRLGYEICIAFRAVG